MKRLHCRWLFVGGCGCLGGLLFLWGSWPSGKADSNSSKGKVDGNGFHASTGPEVVRGEAVTAQPPPALPASAGSNGEGPSASPFAALIAAGQFERVERRPFEAQTWEPDLRKALDLGRSVPLQRTSTLYRVAEFPYSFVRVDRVYRTDRGGPTVAADVSLPKASASQKTEGSRHPLPEEKAEGSRHPLQDTAPPGELLWENAMVADHVMVQVEVGVTKQRLAAALPPRAKVRDQITAGGLYLVAVPAEGEGSVERAVLALNQLKDVVKFAEPDFLMSGADTTANDPLFTTSATDTAKQWYLNKIMAPRAWDVVKEPKTADDAAGTVVAVVDTGIDHTHPDLAPNIWTNPGEAPNNGLDDDGNGKIDDVRGWDFIGQSGVKNTVIQDNDPMDDSGHGTHVAGIIGAVGNNSQGMTGICWSLKILPLRIIKKVGTGTYGTYSTAVGALEYIRNLNRNGRQVAVANHSWGGSGYSLAMFNAINNPVSSADPLPAGIKSSFGRDVNAIEVTGTDAETARIRVGMTVLGAGIPPNTVVTIVNGNAITLSKYSAAARTNQTLTFANPLRPKSYGVLHVAAAGNSRRSSDRIPVYPSCLPSGFIMSVGASNAQDGIAVWNGAAGSNYGRLNVDLFAPGSGILSTKLRLPAESGYGYESRNGTSMAAPQVAAAVALLRLWQPALNELQCRQIAVDQVDHIPAMSGRCMSGGRLNIAKMVDRLYQPNLTGSGGSTGGGGTLAEPLAPGFGLAGLVAKSWHHTLAITEGKVWAWGDNDFNQLGLGATDEESAVPVLVDGVEGAVMVAAGLTTSLALLSDGSVAGWGWFQDGGGSDAEVRSVKGLGLAGESQSQAVWISASWGNALVVNADGKVWGWGENKNGELGDGTTVERTKPVQVLGLQDVIMVSTADTYSMALKSDGTLWFWGNAFGSGVRQRLVPTQLEGFDSIVYVSAGENAAYAIRADGTVWWAGTFEGGESTRLSAGYPNFSLTGLPFPGLADVVFVEAGNAIAAAVTADGRLLNWGQNFSGELGRPTTDFFSGLQEVVLPSDEGVSSVAIDHATVVLLASGEVVSWGPNNAGDLGQGLSGKRRLAARIPGLEGVVRLAGDGNGMAKTSDGTWFAWGSMYTQIPIAEAVIEGLAVLGEGKYGSMTIGLTNDGSLWTWGYAGGAYLSFGNGSPEPTIAWPDDPVRVESLSPVQSFAVGGEAVILLGQDGTVSAWGSNDNGQVGDGTREPRLAPMPLPELSDIVEVAAGDGHAFARHADGTVFAWGRNNVGQLGIGTTDDAPTPVPIPGLTGVSQIVASDDGGIAVKSDGTVWAWGERFDSATYVFELDSPQLVPKKVPGIPPIRSVAANIFSVLLLTVSGTVWSYGYDYLGRSPDLPLPGSTPAEVLGLSGIVQVHAIWDACFALKDDGSVWSWGENFFGSLGDGTSWIMTPATVGGLGGFSATQNTLGMGKSSNSWLLQQFSPTELAQPSVSADWADPDRDGIPNLVEYAIGTHPNIADPADIVSARIDVISAASSSAGVNPGNQLELFSEPVDLVPGNRYLALTVPRFAGIRPDVDLLIEVSTDLTVWKGGDPHTVTVLDVEETLESYSATPLEQVPVQYVRLSVRRKIGGEPVTAFVTGTDSIRVSAISFISAETVLTEASGQKLITARMEPPLPVAVSVPLLIAGTATAGSDYALSANALKFAAGQREASIAITVRKDALEEDSENVVLTLDARGSSIVSNSPAIHVVTIGGAAVPIIIVPPDSQMIAVGTRISLSAIASGVPAPSLRWRKDGANLNQSSSLLRIENAQLKHAGAYELTATNSAGSIASSKALVHVVDTRPQTVRVLADKPAVLRVMAAGNDLRYRWSWEGFPLVDNESTSGSTSSVLTLSADGVLGGWYECVVWHGSQALKCRIQLKVVSGAPIAYADLPDGIVGGKYGPIAMEGASDWNFADRYAATGLPKGLRIDPKTGEISGVPLESKGSPYDVQLWAANAFGSDSNTVPLTIDPLPEGTVGTWIGLIERHPEMNGNRGGRFDMMVASTGAFTGRLINDSSTHSFTGQLSAVPGNAFPVGAAIIRRPSGIALNLNFIIDSEQNRLQGARIVQGNEAAGITGWRNRWNGLEPCPLAAGRQVYHVGINPPEESDLPHGFGYASFGVSPKGLVTLSGRLADGVALISASFAGPENEVLVVQDTPLSDSVGGILNAVAGDDGFQIHGSVLWSRPRQPITFAMSNRVNIRRIVPRVYRDGFDVTSVEVFGGPYQRPQGGEIVMGLPEEDANASISFFGSDQDLFEPLPDLTFRLRAGGKVVLPAVNPRRTSVRLDPNTGTITGSFVLVDPSPTALRSLVTRPVTYQGLIVPYNGIAAGYGYYLLPQLPSNDPPSTTIHTSKILSGAVLLQSTRTP